MSRSERRYRFHREVDRVYRIIHRVWRMGRYIDPIDEHAMARSLAETHCRPCSCEMCRYHKAVPPKRERAFAC